MTSRILKTAVAVSLLLLQIPVAAQTDLLTWQARNVRIVDGDTIEAVIDGDTRATRIRLLGFQAMETNTLRPNTPQSCHAAEATQALRDILAGHSVITLKARSASSSSGGRPLRHLFIERNGELVNVGVELLKTGHGLAFTPSAEPTLDADYIAAQNEAQKTGLNFWNPEYCGPGPDQDAKFDIWLNTDAPGADATNVNGEWIKLQNKSDRAIDLSFWSLRDRFLNILDFPAGTSIAPEQIFTVFVGRGNNSQDTFYLNSDNPIFRNGDFNTAFLMDPLDQAPNSIASGDLREIFVTPDQSGCRDPNAGQLEVFVNFNAPGNDQMGDPNGEFVRISNASNQTISLQKYVLEHLSRRYQFPDGFNIQPQSTITVFVGSGNDSITELYWGNSRAIFRNSGGNVELKGYDERVAGFFSWPTQQPLDLSELGNDCSINTSKNIIIPIIQFLLED